MVEQLLLAAEVTRVAAGRHEDGWAARRWVRGVGDT
jgi:hypothetical protein